EKQAPPGPEYVGGDPFRGAGPGPHGADDDGAEGGLLRPVPLGFDDRGGDAKAGVQADDGGGAFGGLHSRREAAVDRSVAGQGSLFAHRGGGPAGGSGPAQADLPGPWREGSV